LQRRAEPVPRGPPTAKLIKGIVAARLSIAGSTIDKFLRRKSKVEAFVSQIETDKTNHKKHQSTSVRRLGLPGKGGRRPMFVEAERNLANKIRERRSLQLSYPIARVMKDYKVLAEAEARRMGVTSKLYQQFELCKFSSHMRERFLKRANLSGRKVTCKKQMPLSEMIREGRGYFQHMLKLKIDADGFTTDALDPVYGRFVPADEVNSDEVPLPFGSTLRQVNDTALKATHVRVSAGVGDRIATMIVAVTGDGVLLKVTLIFHGSGKRVEHYPENDKVFVDWSAKAWITGEGQLRFYRNVIKPYATLREAIRGKRDILLVQDNVRPHHNLESLVWARQHCSLLSVNLPPNTTHCLQVIDDGIGQMFRLDVLEKINEALEEKGADAKWGAAEKRKLVVRAVTETVVAWRGSVARKEQMVGAATRCGMSLNVGGHIPSARTAGNVDPATIERSLNPKLRPVRFPVDFGASVSDPQHECYNDVKPFAPFFPKGQVPYSSASLASLQSAVRSVGDASAAVRDSGPLILDVAQLDEAEEWDNAADTGEFDDEIEFGPTYDSDNAEEMMVEEGSEDADDCVFQQFERASLRSCLPGCECQDPDRGRRCICIQKYGHCQLSCLCVGCSQVKKDRVRKEDDFFHIDKAIADNEGEMDVSMISSHSVEDGALYFEVVWANDTTSIEPLDNLMDVDGTVNVKLLAYASALKLDLKPHIDLVALILTGKRDSEFVNSESEEERASGDDYAD
jgi:hypothetical protein